MTGRESETDTGLLSWRERESEMFDKIALNRLLNSFVSACIDNLFAADLCALSERIFLNVLVYTYVRGSESVGRNY